MDVGECVLELEDNFGESRVTDAVVRDDDNCFGIHIVLEFDLSKVPLPRCLPKSACTEERSDEVLRGRYRNRTVRL